MSSSSLNEQTSDRLASDVILAECKAIQRIFDKVAAPKGITRSELATRLKIKPPSFSAYMNGQTPLNLNFAIFFAQQMNVTIDAFSPRLADQARAAAQAVGIKSDYFRYPLLEMKEIEHHKEITANFKTGEHTCESFPTDIDAGEHGFWLRIDNDDMETYKGGIGFGKGILVLIDPREKPHVNEYAVLKIKYNPNANLANLIETNHKYLLRLIKHDGESITANALNPSVGSTILNDLNSELVGKVVSAIYPKNMFHT